MSRIATLFLTLALIVIASGQVAEAGQWKYHFYGAGAPYDTCRFVDIRVLGTINCDTIPPTLFEGTVAKCREVKGYLPDWCNDYMVYVDWRPHCHCGNHGWHKYYVSQGTPGDWELPDLSAWVNDHIHGLMEVPVVSDMNGTEIWVAVDIDQWRVGQTELLDQYNFVDGECPDLPGFLAGTTPIVFDPGGVVPMSTTPYTGTLHRTAGSLLSPGAVPSLTEYGLAVLVLLLLISAIWVYRKKKAGAVA